MQTSADKFTARIQRLSHRADDQANHGLTDYIAAADILDGKGNVVGSVPVRPALRSDAETEALTNLFAAAPDLRQEVGRMVSVLENVIPRLKPVHAIMARELEMDFARLRAAYAKATHPASDTADRAQSAGTQS